MKHTYAYVNGLLMYETRGEARFWYSYDANGTLYSVRYTLTDDSSMDTYFFTHNSRGDIVGIYNSSGVLKAQYEYDAWGKVLSVTNANGNAITNENHIGNLNPFRYRGYYYDVESGLYYLMSRYYDPVTHRFVNADGYFQSGGDVLDANMNAYCANNPIVRVDPSGCCFRGLDGGWYHDNWQYIGGYERKPDPNLSNSYDDYLDELGKIESSDNYTAVNQYGYAGRYQMGDLALQDAGFKDSNGGWTDLANSYGVYSQSDFLNSPVAQDVAITNFNTKICGYIKTYGLDSYIGKEYCGVVVTSSGLLASCHLVGVGSMRSALATGQVVWDSNGVYASIYMEKLGGYDISAVW